MTIEKGLATGVLLGFVSLSATANAQAGMGQAGGGMTAISPVQTIQPASGGQVGQPPANSAMRAGSMGAGGSAGARNPMGMAGMGMSSPGSLSLSSAASAARGSMTDDGANGQKQSGVRVTGTGITERTSSGSETGRGR